MNDLGSHVLVRLLPNGNTLGISTYQRDIGRKGRFLVVSDRLAEWLDGHHHTPFYDMDCGHVLCITSNKGILHFRIYWVCKYPANTIRGYEQVFECPDTLVWDVLRNQEPMRYLYTPPPWTSRIDQRISPAAMRIILSDPRKKRALSKAMRDYFKWDDDFVTLYSDGGADFFFRPSSGYPSCGGLILHESSVKTTHGSYPKLSYSIHT